MTTAADLIARADQLTRELRESQDPVSPGQWVTFEATLYRLVTELIGPDASRISLDDPYARVLLAAAHSWPGSSPPGHRDDGKAPRNDEPPPRRSDLSVLPADASGPHPLARLTCALSAAADLIAQAQAHRQTLLLASGQAGSALIHVLSLATVVARHTLAHGDLRNAQQPLDLATYAIEVIDQLRSADQGVSPLRLIATSHDTSTPADLTQRFEAAVGDWSLQGTAELRRKPPSVDLLRAFANQGRDLLDVSATTYTTDVGPGLGSEPTQAFRAAAESLHAVDRAWVLGLTTLVQPGHGFVLASRNLFQALNEITADRADGLPLPERDRIQAALARAIIALADRLIEAEGLPHPAHQIRAALRPSQGPATKRCTVHRPQTRPNRHRASG